MPKLQCPECGASELVEQRRRGWGGVTLLVGLLLLIIGFSGLQSWFPSDSFWQDFMMSESLSVPASYTWWDFMTRTLSFALISGLAIALAGFGVWLFTVATIVCKNCGYKQVQQDHESRSN